MKTAFKRLAVSETHTSPTPSSAATVPPRAQKWCKCSIASVSPVEITHMTCEELAELIATAGDLLPQNISFEKLQTYSRDVLERLAFLARECCRNRGY